jgi:hypothetical protein
MNRDELARHLYIDAYDGLGDDAEDGIRVSAIDVVLRLEAIR